MTESLIQIAYLAAAALFILGLKGLSSPDSARRGMFLAEAGMLFAIVGTLMDRHLVSYEWILAGFVLGSAIGAPMAIFMPMTAMPQRIALSHAFGALAAVLVGIVKYNEYPGGAPSAFFMAAVGFEVLFGALTITGSLMAFGKLQELIKSAPILYKNQNTYNVSLFAGTVFIYLLLIIFPGAWPLFYIMAILGLIIGVLIVMPIGGADMPVVISLLNSYAGLAASATGFAIDNKVLIIAGALDGASGFFLSILMSRAMNRSFTNVLFGAVGAVPETTSEQTEARTVVRYAPDDAVFMLENAQSIIMVPGYGMAVAQAQHMLAELGELLTENGANVRYAIHPVAGRMPGHMNVLLAEADVPYDLLLEMDEINDDFANTDVVVVVGANDVVNPSARYKKDSPLYGMPILNVDKARNVIILKRSLRPGFAGEDNDLFYDSKTMMVFGDAKATLTTMVQMMKKKEKAAA